MLISHAGPNRIYFNDGQANFKVSDHGFGKAGDEYLWVTLADVDRDGNMDAFIFSISSASRLLLNDGRGVFRMTAQEYGGSHAKGYELADLNGDSFPDLILIMRQKPNQIWMNNGAGKFIDSGKTVGIGGYDIECQDCNGDGKIDIVIADSPGSSRIWLNESNTGTFKGGYTIDEGALKCKLVDVDRDGDFDLITADPKNGNKLWLNDGRSNFNYSGQVFGTKRVLRIACDDLDGDGDTDVVLGQIEGSGGHAIYFNESIRKKQKKLSAKK
ncbi:MAG: VCBS repeat-containing protein [Candidatus Aminicenantes bacterium]|nr:VCBS repeat-containing protein [Candidatus Aminicenantes bacterium]